MPIQGLRPVYVALGPIQHILNYKYPGHWIVCVVGFNKLASVLAYFARLSWSQNASRYVRLQTERRLLSSGNCAMKRRDRAGAAAILTRFYCSAKSSARHRRKSRLTARHKQVAPHRITSRRRSTITRRRRRGKDGDRCPTRRPGDSHIPPPPPPPLLTVRALQFIPRFNISRHVTPAECAALKKQA